MFTLSVVLILGLSLATNFNGWIVLPTIIVVSGLLAWRDHKKGLI